MSGCSVLCVKVKSKSILSKTVQRIRQTSTRYNIHSYLVMINFHIKHFSILRTVNVIKRTCAVRMRSVEIGVLGLVLDHYIKQDSGRKVKNKMENNEN